jgi:hypothetical protein
MSSLKRWRLNEKEVSEQELFNLFLLCGNFIIQQYQRE